MVSPNCATTASGPGVGGTEAWVMFSAQAMASARPVRDFFLAWEMDFTSGASRIRAESAKMGMETRKPVMARAISSFLPRRTLMKVWAITLAALDSSMIWPIMQPNAMTRPMLARVLPKPDVISPGMVASSTPPTTPTTQAEMTRDRDGCSRVFMIKTIRTAIPTNRATINRVTSMVFPP